MTRDDFTRLCHLNSQKWQRFLTYEEREEQYDLQCAFEVWKETNAPVFDETKETE